MGRAVYTETLAINGGPKAVQRPLNRYKGAALIGEEEQRAVLEVLEHKSLFRYYGPDLLYKVAQFEAAFADYLQILFVSAASSGTAALRIGLAALGIGAGDEVIVPAVTFIASIGAIVAQGAIPIFAEVDEQFTLDPAQLEACITPRTRAIMPVHLFGIAADMDPIMEIARRYQIAVIEDTAQACGSFYKARRLGTIGEIGAFSFQLEKNITRGEVRRSRWPVPGPAWRHSRSGRRRSVYWREPAHDRDRWGDPRLPASAPRRHPCAARARACRHLRWSGGPPSAASTGRAWTRSPCADHRFH